MTSITIPNSVTSIENGAFWYCSSLTSVTIPNSVTSIGDNAFYKCRSLTSITIPNSVTSIENGAFSGCSSLTSIIVETGNTTYDSRENCNAMIETASNTLIAGCQKTIIPNSVTSIGMYAFRSCSSLTSVTIPNSVTNIGWGAFSDCSSLTSVTCEAENPPTVDYDAFYNVSESIPVYVPCGCVKAYKAKSGWEDFTNIQEPLVKYSIEVNVNDAIMGTAKVDYNTFCEGNQISATPNFGYHFVQWSDGNTDNPRTLVLTQDTILTAEFAQLFSGQCGNSLYWEFADETLHITGSGKMYDYNSYDNVPWTSLVTSIKFVTIGNSVTSIGDYAFDGCSGLTSITIPNSVTSIGKYAFDDCSGLTSVTIPNSVTSIGDYAFYDCDNLTSVTINSDAIVSKEYSSTSNLSHIFGSQVTEYIIGDDVTSIGNAAFRDCSSLASITIGNSVTSIGDWAFNDCSALESIVWNARNCADASSLETAPFYAIRSQISSCTFGKAVEHIPAYLCYGMEKLTSITTPNSLNTIGTSAFEGCARLGKINLGTGLEEIAANAFAGCTRLYDIYVYATYPPFAEESSFANYNVYVYIPCEYQRGYTLDVVWGKFKFIECIESEDATTDGNVTVDPGFNDVTITWPTDEKADSYSLVINKAGEPFCTLTFNADGQLLNIAFAPGRDGNHPVQYAEQAVNGYRFTVTGLTKATQYAYIITTKDAASKTIATYSGEFTTKGGITTAVEDILQNTINCQKIIRNGQLLILRDGKTYTIMGQVMKEK